jgi:glutathione S-transferase
LYEGDYKQKILAISPAGKVPALVHGRLVIGESMAIMEYLADIYPALKMWPDNVEDRAKARAVSQEMHAGFSELRKNMPMNLRGHFPGKGLTPQVQSDIQRIDQIWGQCRNEYQKTGPFLFGRFSISDAMFAPVVTRFKTYGVKISPVSQQYAEAITELPAMKEWTQVGVQEPYIIPASEIYR